MACRVLSTVLRRVQCLKPFSALLSAPAVERPQGEGQRKVLAAVLFTPVEPRTLEQAALAVAREVALRQVACHSPDTVKWISAMLLKTVTPPGSRVVHFDAPCPTSPSSARPRPGPGRPRPRSLTAAVGVLHRGCGCSSQFVTVPTAAVGVLHRDYSSSCSRGSP